MAKQSINIGTSANDRTGDSLRSAFNKINENFTDLYTALGLDEGGLNLGAFEFTGSVLTTTDSSAIIVAQQLNVTSDLVMSGDIVPDADNLYDLGSADKQWRSLYVSSDTIFIGGVSLKLDDENRLIIGDDSTILGGAVSYNDLTDTPTIPTVPTAVSSFTNDAGYITLADVTGEITVNPTGDLKGSVFADDSTLLVDSVNGSIPYSVISDVQVTESDLLVDFATIVATQIQTNGLPINTTATGTLTVNGQFTVEESFSSTPTTKFFEIETGAGNNRLLRTGVNMSSFAQQFGPQIDLTSYRSSPQDGDAGPGVVLRASTLTSVNDVIATIGTEVTDVSAGDVTSKILFTVQNNGSNVTPLTITGTTVDMQTADQVSISNQNGAVDIYGEVEFNNGTTAFQAGNSVDFNCPVDFSGATVTGLSIAPQTTLDGDVTGSVFADDSTLLVDGVAGKIVGDVETARLRTSETTIALGGGAGLTTQGVRAVAIGEEAGRTDQGVRAVAIGYYAGQTNQSPTAVAIGDEAGRINQGIRTVALGYLAGGADQGTNAVAIGDEAGQTSQGNRAVAIGLQAGETSQGVGGVAIGEQAGQTLQGVLSVAIGYYAGQTNQSFSAVAIGAQAGEWLQGAGAIAIGDLAGQTAQGNNSIVINATGVALNNTVANTFVVKPVRAATGTSILQYDATTGEITHTNEISSDQQISITVAGEDSTEKTWYFGNDGDLTAPGGISVAGILKIDDGVHEKFQALADATGTVTHDCSSGHIFYHTSPDANWTANLTNLDLSTAYATSVTIVVVQGGTGYYPNALQIGGVTQTINWQGGADPTPGTNGVDVVTFSILNSSGTYTVLGQLTDFSTVA